MGATHAQNFTEVLYGLVNRGILRGNYLRDKVLDYSADKTEREYMIFDRKGRLVVGFRARPLPGCCGILVVYYLRPGSAVKEPQKVFTDTLDLILEAAGLSKIGSVLLTQTVDSLGFKALASSTQPRALFTNWKTSNNVGVFMLETAAPAEEAKKANFSSE